MRFECPADRFSTTAAINDLQPIQLLQQIGSLQTPQIPENFREELRECIFEEHDNPQFYAIRSGGAKNTKSSNSSAIS